MSQVKAELGFETPKEHSELRLCKMFVNRSTYEEQFGSHLNRVVKLVQDRHHENVFDRN